jgi:hypothetical protein
VIVIHVLPILEKHGKIPIEITIIFCWVSNASSWDLSWIKTHYFMFFSFIYYSPESVIKRFEERDRAVDSRGVAEYLRALVITNAIAEYLPDAESGKPSGLPSLVITLKLNLSCSCCSFCILNQFSVFIPDFTVLHCSLVEVECN